MDDRNCSVQYSTYVHQALIHSYGLTPQWQIRQLVLSFGPVVGQVGGLHPWLQ